MNICLCLRQLLKPALYALKYKHNTYTKYLPTCFDTPWVPSSGSLHNS